MSKVLLQRSAAGATSTSSKSSGPRKLLSDAFELLPLEEVGQQLSDATDFTVVGVLGSQGAGKSTLMSLLAGSSWSNIDAAAASGEALQLLDPPFPPQPAEAVLQAVHHTAGIDLYVTPERLLLLDTQALLSPSALVELQRREAALPADVQSHENLLELHSLRLAMLVLSVCHVVVCVQDVPLAPLELRTIRLAQMLRHRLPDVSHLALSSPAALALATAAVAASATDAVDQSGGSTAAAAAAAPTVEYTPGLAFVYNRMAPNAFAPGARATLRDVLRRLFPPSPWEPPTAAPPAVAPTSSVSTAASVSGSGGGGGGGSEAAATDEAAGAPSVLLLPSNSGAAALVCGAHAGYRAEAEAARDALLALRRAPFARSISEREWLRGVGRMWELIRRSALLSDYNKEMKKLHYFQ